MRPQAESDTSWVPLVINKISSQKITEIMQKLSKNKVQPLNIQAESTEMS